MTNLPSDVQLIGSFEVTGSCHKTGLHYGLPGHVVYKRLRALGVVEENAALEKELERPAPVATLDPSTKWKGMSLDDWLTLFKREKIFTIRQFCKRNKVPEGSFTKKMEGAFPEEWRCLVASRFKKSGRYVRGRKVEIEVREDLRSRGYPFSYRTPLSRGPFDVIAIKPQGTLSLVLMVQCKSSMKISPEEVRRLCEAAIPCGAVPILAGKPDGVNLQYVRLTLWQQQQQQHALLEPFEP